MAAAPDADFDDFLATVAVTRLVLGPEDAHPGAAEPGVARRVPGPARRRRRRLGRRLAADTRPRQPRTAVARARRTRRGDRRGGLRPGATADRPAAVRAGRRGVDRPAGAARTSPRWPTRETGFALDVNPVGRPWQEPDEASRVAGPHRSAHRDRHRGPAHRHPQRSGQRVRRLGVHPRPGGRAGGPRARAHRHRRARRAALRRARSGRLQRRRVPRAGHRRRSGAGCRCRAGGFAATRRRRRRRHVRGEPQHQLHQHLLHRLPVLRVRPAQGRRRRVLAVHRRGRRPGVGGARRRCHRGLHAGRHRPRTAGHRLRRPGARGQGAGAVDARARVLADGDRQRRHQERHRAFATG